MSERKPGWYWVKWPHETKWCVAQYMGRVGERLMWSSGDIIQSDAPREIGPRIPTPDEPWQAVPVEPVDEMIDEGAQAIVSWDDGCKWPESWGADAVRHRKDCRKAYRAMLAAAPKPEDS